MADIFISYAKEDREKAHELARLLEQRHWTVWWDRKIEIGESFYKVIEREILACRCAIVLWTRASVASDWVRGEAAMAKMRDVLVPILAEDVPPPIEFFHLQAADLTTWTDVANDAEFEKVVRRIEQLTAASRSEHTPPPPIRRPVADSDRIRRAHSDQESRRSQRSFASRIGLPLVALVLVVALGGAVIYWAGRPAPDPPAAQQRSVETANPAPAAANASQTPVITTDTPPRQNPATPQVSQGKTASPPQPPAYSNPKSREGAPAESIASKERRSPEPPSEPRVRIVDLPGFNLS